MLNKTSEFSFALNPREWELVGWPTAKKRRIKLQHQNSQIFPFEKRTVIDVHNITVTGNYNLGMKRSYSFMSLYLTNENDICHVNPYFLQSVADF